MYVGMHVLHAGLMRLFNCPQPLLLAVFSHEKPRHCHLKGPAVVRFFNDRPSTFEDHKPEVLFSRKNVHTSIRLPGRHQRMLRHTDSPE